MSAEYINVDEGPQPFEVYYCPKCGERCAKDTTWCSVIHRNERLAIEPILVRWTPEVLK